MPQMTSKSFSYCPEKPFGKKLIFVIRGILIIVLITLNTCERPERVIQLSTLEVLPDDISFTEATLKGEITDLGSAPIDDHGILVSDNSTPRIGNSHVASLGKCSSKGSFQVSAGDLAINTTYYFRAFASIGGEDIYANAIKQFITRSCNPPSVVTAGVSAVTTTSAQSGGNVTADGGAPVTARGVCWSTTNNPTIFSDTTVNGAGTGSFSSVITGLTDNTPYHVRAYAINAAGPTYGDDVPFITTGVPAVTTKEISLLTATSASTGGEVTSDRGSPVTARGVCWGITLNPTIDNSYTTNGLGTGPFTSSITGLTSGRTYHVRAYARNSVGIGYGEDVPFTTLGIPDVVTSPVSLITGFSALSGGNVISDGGANVTARGVCWSLTINPTATNSHTTNGAGVGLYESSITGLTPGTTYHVRAYATNSIGTDYGDDIQFKTANKPIVTTAEISSLTSVSVVSGGNVVSDENAPVTAKGVCWGTTENPAIGGSHTTDGTGTGPFVSTINNLTPGTSYHVRAYATNSVGTSYGTDFLFRTLSKPVLSTIEINSITPTSAKSGGNITYDGGAAVTARGVCWNTTGTPTINDSKSSDGQGPGLYPSDITGLTQATTYFVRAYASNSVGIVVWK